MQKTTNKHTPDVTLTKTKMKRDAAPSADGEEQAALREERDRALRRAALNRVLLEKYLPQAGAGTTTESDRIEADNDYRREQGRIEEDYQKEVRAAKEREAKTRETLEKYYAEQARKDQDTLYRDTVESIRAYEFADAEALDQILSSLSPYLRKEQKEYLERLSAYYRRK